MLQLYGKPIFSIDGAEDDLQLEQVIDFSGGENDYGGGHFGSAQARAVSIGYGRAGEGREVASLAPDI
jgi:hypothetical protein